MTTLNQMHKQVRRDRDKTVVAEVADRFTKQADRAFVEGRTDDAAQLRETALLLRTVPLRQATAFLGTIWNSNHA